MCTHTYIIDVYIIIMYMHKNKKIIICKFNLKNKCQFGKECKFLHLSINELNCVLNKMEDLKQENESLKSDLRNKCLEIRFLENKFCDVTNDSVHVLKKPLYNSFFKKKNQNESAKIEPKKQTETKYTVQNDDSGLDDETEFDDDGIIDNKYISILNKQKEIEKKLKEMEKVQAGNQAKQTRINGEVNNKLLEHEKIAANHKNLIVNQDKKLEEMKTNQTEMNNRIDLIGNNLGTLKVELVEDNQKCKTEICDLINSKFAQPHPQYMTQPQPQMIAQPVQHYQNTSTQQQQLYYNHSNTHQMFQQNQSSGMEVVTSQNPLH
jgi:hypothetical protein